LIAQRGDIDLLVTDIVMPGAMNGDELVHEARALRPDIKIIYSSGFPAKVLEEKIMPLVDGPLLHKPYQRAEFAAMVQSVLADSHAELAK
jgi:CheY-like chemotaxis protein